jgi:hypothetical protein
LAIPPLILALKLQNSPEIWDHSANKTEEDIFAAAFAEHLTDFSIANEIVRQPALVIEENEKFYINSFEKASNKRNIIVVEIEIDKGATDESQGS